MAGAAQSKARVRRETAVTQPAGAPAVDAPKTLDELKAHAYDTARLLGALQQELQQTNEAIARAEVARATP